MDSRLPNSTPKLYTAVQNSKHRTRIPPRSSRRPGPELAPMKLAIGIGYSGARLTIPMDLILEVERMGYDSVWTAEAYGSDAVTPLAYIAAKTERIKLGTSIMQIPARTPAMCAMQMATLDALSGGRALCGLGLSGPQVVEGWHGVPYGKPAVRTREYVE